MASLLDLPGFAEQVLSDFAAQLTGQGISVPERQYVTPGSMIPWDGEQFTVTLMGIDQGQPGQGQAQSQVPQAVAYYASFSLNLIRKVPVISTEGFAAQSVPTAEDLDASGQTFIADAAALILAASRIHTAYLETPPGEGFVAGPLQPVGPEGGLAGSRLLLTVSLS
jgi:hypothetical protein